jgi:hypothetical protein
MMRLMQHVLAMRFGKPLALLSISGRFDVPRKRKASPDRINIGFPLNPFRACADLTMLGI